MPVVTTLYGHPKDAEGEWWRSITKQGGWGTGRFHGVTPQGKMLCGGDAQPGCGGGNCTPEKALARWLALPACERAPGTTRVEDLREMDAAYPKRPPGSIILKGYNRPLEPAENGELKRPKFYRDCQELSPESLNWKTFENPEPGRTFVWLSEEQWKSLIPANPLPGLTVRVPDAVADRIVRLTLLNTIY